jgi:hypothetical protein
MRFYRNAKGGTNTVELGPSLFIILIIILIPAIDFMQIGLAYACGWYANFCAVRAAACAGPLNATTAANGAVAAWDATGLGKFLHAPVPVNSVNVVPPDTDGDGKNDFVEVKTVVTMIPMFPIPWATGTQIVFQYDTIRPLEEKNLQ